MEGQLWHACCSLWQFNGTPIKASASAWTGWCQRFSAGHRVAASRGYTNFCQHVTCRGRQQGALGHSHHRPWLLPPLCQLCWHLQSGN